jgi:hypothetical protein
MKNSLRAILFLLCLTFIACKKNDIPDTIPKISFTFNGKHVQYSGNATNVQYEGVALVPVQTTVDSSEFQYQVLAGENNANYFVIIFNGPYPLQKSNIARVSFFGIAYQINGMHYSCHSSMVDMNIKVDGNNLLTGTFSGFLYSLQDGHHIPLTGKFKNVLIR